MSKILKFIDIHTFIVISYAISIYFGIHGNLFLMKKWGWPWYVSVPTIVLIELIWWNVFRTKTYQHWIKVIAGIIAMSFCVSLPLISSYFDYENLKRTKDTVTKLEEPVYFEEMVIPALQEEIDALEDKLSPRKAERDRRLSYGDKIYMRMKQKKGGYREYSGTEAAGWIPSEGKETEDFSRVEKLKKEKRMYYKMDMEAKNTFKVALQKQKAKIKGLQSDVENGGWSFIFKGVLILVLGGFSYFYMIYYYKPRTEEKEIYKKSKKSKKINAVKDKNKIHVLESHPDAVGVTTEDKTAVNIVLEDGRVIGTGANAPNAWRNAKNNL